MDEPRTASETSQGIDWNDKEQVKAYNRAYHLKNKERIAAQTKAYREAHKEEIKLHHKKHYAENRDRILKRMAIYRSKNGPQIYKAKKRCYEQKQDHYNAVCHRWAVVNKEKVVASRRRHRLTQDYGITVPEYNLMLEQQNYACALCGKTEQEAGRYLCVDHDHATGKVRGLLCLTCNLMIGHANENSELMRKGAAYLEKAGRKESPPDSQG